VSVAGQKITGPNSSYKRRQGFSVLELLIVMAVGLIMTGIVLPNFMKMLRSYRRDAAVNQIVGDLRKARAEAIRTGWQYRIYGFNYGSTNPFKNQYRVLGRSSAGAGWPGGTVAAFQNATQMAGSWVDMNKLYPGVRLNPSDTSDDFWVAFDSRGVRIELEASFNPLSVVNAPETAKSVSVATVGSVKAQ
jgi:prepilin-type N-terminal cleavage/methylation domain-containing protein